MDDGIELNFATGDSVVARKPAIQKGGRWTDRAKQRKDARQSYQQIAKRSAPTQSSTPTTAAPVRASPAAVPAPPVPQVEAPTPRPSQAPAVARPVPAKSTTSTGSTQNKRPRQSSPRQQRPSYDQQPVAGPSRIPAGPPQPKGQIISSLFSSNPVPSVRPTSTKPVIGAPSNAPLTGDTNTFPGLGLDPLLVHHLTNKMGVKAPTSIQRSSLPFMLSEPLDLSTPTYNEDGEEDTKPVIQKALRDVFIQSQTGSGKTLTYLLPIIQTLLPLSKLSHIDRSIGTLAIILAPTRELAQQIEKVLDQVLSMALSLPDSDITDERYTRWLVSGLLVGGSTRTHEKAKLRKGVPILVATPGRLLDHLQNTASFQCAKTMFLVLDEADRVMDLGFEETIQGIIKALDGRRRLEIAAEKEMDEVGGGTMRWPFWGRGRRTILCSATVDSKVQKLAGVALQDPILFKGTDDKPKDADSKVKEATSYDPTAIELPQTNLEKFTPPSQLSQKYVVVPTKLRLVALVALIRSFVASATEGGNKIIVFLSSTDAVDFLWKMLGGIRMDRDDNVTASKDASAVTLQSPLFPNTNLQRLHGSLPLQTRRSSLAAFAAASKSPSVLFATSVASRGLDLPLVRAVIQYDLPTEGGANEYVHRVGRTARAGKGGEAWAMVAPNETGWVKWVEGKMGAVGEKEVKLGQAGVEEVLKKGFGGKGYEYEARATQAQLAFERWVTDDEQNAAMSRKAFASFVRAYSTHPLEEKVFFHPKSLHLGHLAKAFALREAPSVMAGMTKASAKTAATAASTKQPAKKRKREDGEEGASSDGSDDDEPAAKGGKESTARNETERRMYEAVRKAGRAVKSGGALGEFDKKVRGVNGRKPTAMASSGGGEFQVMGGDEIERIVSGKRR